MTAETRVPCGCPRFENGWEADPEMCVCGHPRADHRAAWPEPCAVERITKTPERTAA